MPGANPRRRLFGSSLKQRREAAIVDNRRSHPTRIAVIGAGNACAGFAYALLMNGLASEIVLIDVKQSKADGEAMDLYGGKISL